MDFDGSLSSIVGRGSIPISKNLILNFVLYVPNLFSVSKFTKNSYCVAKFLSHYCEF